MNTQLKELRRLLAEIDSLAGSVEVSGLIRDARACAEIARRKTAKAIKIVAELDTQQVDGLLLSGSSAFGKLPPCSDVEKTCVPLPTPSTALAKFTDTERLNFMLGKYRKVIVEVLPGNRRDVYVEEGFMGDVQGPAFTVRGDIGPDELLEGKRRAIDLAMQQEGDANGD